MGKGTGTVIFFIARHFKSPAGSEKPIFKRADLRAEPNNS